MKSTVDSYGSHEWCIIRGGRHLALGLWTVTLGILVMWDVHGNITCDINNIVWIILNIPVICFLFSFSFGRMYERVCGREWKYICYDHTFWLSGPYAILIFVTCRQVSVLQCHTNLFTNNILDGYEDPYKIYKGSNGNP